MRHLKILNKEILVVESACIKMCYGLHAVHFLRVVYANLLFRRLASKTGYDVICSSYFM